MPRRKCTVCGEWFTVPSKKTKRSYCSRYCMRQGRARNMVKTREIKNRPLTPYTADIVRMWYEEGDSVELIANVLNRNKDTILDIVEGRIK